MAAAKKAPAKKAPAKKASAKKAPPEAAPGVQQAAKKPAASKAPAKAGRRRSQRHRQEGRGEGDRPAKAPVKQGRRPRRRRPARPRKAAAKKSPATKAPAKSAAKSTSPSERRGTASTCPNRAASSKDGIAYTKDFDVKFLKAQRDLLDEEKAQADGPGDRLENEANSLIEEAEMGDVQFDDEGGEGDTMVVERERDLALSAQARQTIADIDAGTRATREGHVRLLRGLGAPDPAGTPRGDSVGDRARRGEGRRDRAAMTRSTRAVRGSVLIALLDRRPRPTHEGLGALCARRSRHRPVLDVALPPHAQQRHGVQPRRGARAGDRCRRSRRRRRAAGLAASTHEHRPARSPSVSSSVGRPATSSIGCSGRRAGSAVP